MLSPDYLKELGAQVEELYAGLEDDLIADIARRIVSTDFRITQSAVWQAEVLERSGMVRSEITRRVARAANENEETIGELFEEGGLETLRYDDEVYRKAGLDPLPLKQSPEMLQKIAASAKKCNGELKNLTKTTAAHGSSIFRQVCDRAYLQVISGGFDYNTAIRRAVRDAGRAGAKVIYPKGGTAQLDVAVRRAVLTGVNQTAGEIQIMRMDEMGTELVEVSAHFGARPDHAEWQGQVYYYREPVEGYKDFVDSTGYGSGDGLMGWNCRHSFFPYYEGASKRAYSDEELREMKGRMVSYDGRELTDYEASQTQRKMERDIRATKRELIATDSARNVSGIDPALKEQLGQDYTAASLKLERQKETLADFLGQTGRAEDRARTMVDGFDRSHAQASVWSARKSGLTKGGESGKITVERGIKGKQALNSSDNKVDLKYVNSDEYKKKFNSLPYSRETNEEICKLARAALTHRNGTNYEDMYLIDSRSGAVMGKQTASKAELCVEYNKSLKNAVNSSERGTLISLHNHPTANPPTGSDFASMSRRGYHSGVVACHNGKVYWYKTNDPNLNAYSIDIRIDEYIRHGADVASAHKKALNECKKQFGIEWREI